MNNSTSCEHIPSPSGNIESHAHLLNIPSDDQLLYKMMSAENFLRSFTGSYLHFNRVDSYKDFPSADPHDGEQLPKDQEINASITFQKAPDFSVAHYYDQSRSRTYACCFSLENSDFIWHKYATGSEIGKLCVVFRFGDLREALNRALETGNTLLQDEDGRSSYLFWINYGIVEYVEWNNYQANVESVLNPIKYTYLKDKRFSEEKELRVSLSALGMGNFKWKDGAAMLFEDSLKMPFDFRAASGDGTIQEILCAPDCDFDVLGAELAKVGIELNQDSILPLDKG